MTDVDDVTPAVLAGYDVVILGKIPLTTAQATLFTDWVNGGGQLIAMRPDKKLASLLGLDRRGCDARATVPADRHRHRRPAPASSDETIQFHGTADLYTLAGATTHRDAVLERHDRRRRARP